MRPNDKKGGREATPPSTFGEGTPGFASMDSNAFVLQTVNQLSTTVGGLCKQVDHLERAVDKLTDEVNSHGKRIYAAVVICVIGVGLLGWIATQVADIAKHFLPK